MGACGCVQALVRLTNSSDELVKKNASFALKRLAASGDDCKRVLVGAGAVPFLLKVTQCSNVRAVTHVVQCLGSLALVDEYAEEIRLRGGTKRMIPLLNLTDHRLLVSTVHALA